MTVPRVDATATLLADGKVLVVGGQEDFGGMETIFASAELYDPETGKFILTGSMSAARVDHTATLLPDGRVLVVGGWGCRKAGPCYSGFAGSLASAELYDPKTGKFSSTGSMSTGRDSATATLLQDGRVLLAGNSASLTAELYDPASGRFARTGNSLIEATSDNATATLLPNGKILVTGTADSGPRAELYDPEKGQFTSISFALAPGAAASAQYNGKSVGRVAPDTATLLKDGRVVLFESGYLEAYVLATGVFTPAGFLSPPGRWGSPTATLLADGRVLFAGGSLLTDPSASSYAVAASIALYDSADGPHLIGPMGTARDGQTSTLLPDRSVLIAGGTADGENALATAELFRP
jgi:hypothetical protein